MRALKFSLRSKQLGLTIAELMVSIAISMTVLSGVVQVLVVSKSNFVTDRELATLQENARFAIKFLGDEIRMAGYTGCASTPLFYANSIRTSGSNWYLDSTGLQGFEYDAGINSFPAEFRADVAANTDAIVIRRGETTGLTLNGSHNANSANIPLNKAHSHQPGEIMVIASPDCTQIGVFQLTGPTNNSNNATKMNHNKGNNNPSPGNCSKALGGDYDCSDESSSAGTSYGQGSRLMKMSSTAFYIGVSETDNTVPALHRELLQLTGSTIGTNSEELVQGLENLQILYGLDNAFNDGVPDIYVKANSGSMNWANVVTVRFKVRMRSINPVYNEDVAYPVFEGVVGTDGADRFMRQTLAYTVQIRNS